MTSEVRDTLDYGADREPAPASTGRRRTKRMDRSSDFVRHLEALRVKYKIKRNFMKVVEQKRKSLYL